MKNLFTYSSIMKILESEIVINDNNLVMFLTIKAMVKDVKIKKSIHTRINNSKAKNSDKFLRDMFQFIEYLILTQEELQGTYAFNYMLKYRREAILQILKKSINKKRFVKNYKSFNVSEFIKMMKEVYKEDINHIFVKSILILLNESKEKAIKSKQISEFKKSEQERRKQNGAKMMQNISKASFV